MSWCATAELNNARGGDKHVPARHPAGQPALAVLRGRPRGRQRMRPHRPARAVWKRRRFIPSLAEDRSPPCRASITPNRSPSAARPHTPPVVSRANGTATRANGSQRSLAHRSAPARSVLALPIANDERSPIDSVDVASAGRQSVTARGHQFACPARDGPFARRRPARPGAAVVDLLQHSVEHQVERPPGSPWWRFKLPAGRQSRFAFPS
jgi:hypothetical protein